MLLLSVETTVVARHLKSRSQGLKAQKNMPSRVKIPEVVFQGNVMMGDALEQHQVENVLYASVLSNRQEETPEHQSHSPKKKRCSCLLFLTLTRQCTATGG